jgi:hypothetical protein
MPIISLIVRFGSDAAAEASGIRRLIEWGRALVLEGGEE